MESEPICDDLMPDEMFILSVKELLEWNKMSSAKLARTLGMTRQQWYLYESGKRKIYLALAARVAKTFDTTVSDMMGER